MSAITYKATDEGGAVVVRAYGPDPFGGIGEVSLGPVLTLHAANAAATGGATNVVRLLRDTREILEAVRHTTTAERYREVYWSTDESGARVAVTVPERE